MRRALVSLALLSSAASIGHAAAPPSPRLRGPGPIFERLHIIAPAAPGGGWDLTARALAAALRAEGLVRVVEVENVPGAAGTIGLAKFVSAYRGDEHALMVTGLVMMSAIVMNDSPVSLAEATPVARLTGEYEVVVVPASSPFRSFGDLASALRASPGAVSWAGGSAGGTDHLLVGLLAKAVGVDPARANYVAFSGGGESVAALLGGQVSAGVSGLSEYRPHITAGSLRALGLSAPESAPGVSIPTFREQGVDVWLSNWRGLVAPPGIRPEAREKLVRLIERVVPSPSWRDALARSEWVDLHLPGERFSEFLRTEQKRVTAVVRNLKGTRAAGSAETRRGTAVFPAIVGVGLLVTGGLLGLRAWSARGKPEPSARPNRNPSALAFLAIGVVADLVLLEPAGFIVASSVLFWFVARGFGSRRWVRDAVLAVTFSTGAYFLFTRVLTLSLPAGRLFP